MTLSDHQWAFLQDIAKLIIFAKGNGFKLTGSYLKRDYETQKRLFDAKLSKTMKSKHLDALALDLNFFKNDILTYKREDSEILGKYWESLNKLNRWGGFWQFSDTPHFERNV